MVYWYLKNWKMEEWCEAVLARFQIPVPNHFFHLHRIFSKLLSDIATKCRVDSMGRMVLNMLTQTLI